MADNVAASPQAINGPAFAAKNINGVYYPTSVGPVLAATTSLDNVLDGSGDFTLAPVPGCKYRYVYNKDPNNPLTITFGVGGMTLTLNPAPAAGWRGDQWDMSFFYWDGAIVLSGADGAEFGAGYGA